MFKRRKNRGVPRDLALMIEAMRGLMADSAGVAERVPPGYGGTGIPPLPEDVARAAHLPSDLADMLIMANSRTKRECFIAAADELTADDCRDTDHLVPALLARIRDRANWFSEGIPPVIPHEAGFGYETTRRVIEAVNDGVLPEIALDGGPEQWRLPLFAVLAELHRQERVAVNLLSDEADWATEDAARAAARRAFTASFAPITIEDVKVIFPVGSHIREVWVDDLPDHPDGPNAYDPPDYHLIVQGYTSDSIVLMSSTSQSGTQYEELLDGRLERDEHGRVWWRWYEEVDANGTYYQVGDPKKAFIRAGLTMMMSGNGDIAWVEPRVASDTLDPNDPFAQRTKER